MKKILIHPATTPFATEVYFGEDLLVGPAVEFLARVKGKAAIVADSVVKDLYAEDLAKRVNAELLTIGIGERVKTQETVSHLMEQLFQIGAGRDATLVALGGGVTTDLAGFAASTYMRGISLVLIPTTLLGCVDAAIGGKTGIDTPFGKNLIGTIYHPKAIFIDLNTLKTLPEKEWLNGFAEILKLGLVQNSSIWELTGKSNPTLIFKAIQGKIAVIEQDPNEQGMRRILNFGHTIGHALETVAHYAISHGEAVALGCLTESYLSMGLGYLSKNDFRRIQEMYGRFSLKLPKTYTRAKLLEAMSHDKKKRAGEVRFVLIDRIGHAIPFEGAYCRTVAQKELESTLDWMEGSY
ncbi:MAG: 3-dehydroquinate synthase [Waddliaceae bacterium]